MNAQTKQAAKIAELEALGWRVEVVWQCSLGNIESLTEICRRLIS